MATLTNLSALMIFLVINAVLLPTATAGNLDCAKGMTNDCGSGLFQIIVLADTFSPSNECCRELVKVGKDCHKQFVESILSTHKGIRGTASDVYRRSNETWNNCVAATKSVSPPEPAR